MLPTVKPVSKFGVWANEVNKAVSSNALVSSLDTLTDKTNNGTTVKLKQLHTVNRNQFGIPTRYDCEEFYAVHDTVFVTDTEIPAEYTASIIGTWMCLKTVPSNKFSDIPDVEQYGPQYKRQEGINYYPIWPMPEAEEDQYWLFLGGDVGEEIEVTICKDNVELIYYLKGRLSGSVA